jgi:hypothetical protein
MILNAVLSKLGRSHRYVYLPTGGFISRVTLMDGSQLLEVGRGSRDGMVGAEALSSVLAGNSMTLTFSGSGKAPRFVWLFSVNRYDLSSRIALASVLN